MILRNGSGREPTHQLFEDYSPPPPPPSPQLDETGTSSLDGEITITIEIRVSVVEETEEEDCQGNILDGRYKAMIFQYVVYSTGSSLLMNGRKVEEEFKSQLYPLVVACSMYSTQLTSVVRSNDRSSQTVVLKSHVSAWSSDLMEICVYWRNCDGDQLFVQCIKL